MPWTAEVPRWPTAGTNARITAPDVLARKGSDEPLVMVTAYDAPSARVVDAAGADMILVGDSLAMVVLGYDDTLQVTTDDMAHHVAAVARVRARAARRRRPAVAQLPRQPRARPCATRPRSSARGAGAVKLEGGRKRLDAIAAILDAEIPVMGHIGLTPQSIHALGGFKVQGKQLDAARRLVDDAVALAEAGCFAIVLEAVPDGVARMITETVPIPTIGIGAGRHCDGQVLVCHDMLGFAGERSQGAEVRAPVRSARSRRDGRPSREFVADVRAGRFPSSAETYHMTDQMADALGLYGGTARRARAHAIANTASVHRMSQRVGSRSRVAIGVGRRAAVVGVFLMRDGGDDTSGAPSPERRRSTRSSARAWRKRRSRGLHRSAARASNERCLTRRRRRHRRRTAPGLAGRDRPRRVRRHAVRVRLDDIDARVHDGANADRRSTSTGTRPTAPTSAPTTMAPCPEGSDATARSTVATGPYRFALETAAGNGASAASPRRVRWRSVTHLGCGLRGRSARRVGRSARVAFGAVRFER